MVSDPFVVMAKPVGPHCNLQCGYCYYLETEQFFETPHKFRMSDETLEEYTRQYIEASPGPVIQFTWHGGEPTLAGLDFFRRAIELQKKYLPEGWSCWNNLQTNGILLDDAWCTFLAVNKFDVGISIDGTQWLHDEYRKDHRGNGTYERVVKSIKLLQAHGIQPDLLCTVTSSIAKEPLAVYRALRNLNTGWMQFIPIVRRTPEGEVTPDSVSGEAYGKFLCTIFDEWIANDLDKVGVQLFAELSLIYSGRPTNLCWMAPTCGRILVVEHDGGVYSCDHFVNPDHHIGNIDTSNLGSLVELPLQHQFGKEKQDLLPKQCKTCTWLEVCNGACPKDRFALSDDNEPGLNYLCSGYKMIYSHADKPLKQVHKLRTQGFSPAGIMQQLQAESAQIWKNIGRNDPCPCGSGKKAKHCCWDKRP